ncbi:histone H4-like [Ambystoma mexicanum]|uniref:histone H4-like n=1 Tax=Ambystoma mexicanum TaxID=8296 RepID=UPI0037E91A4D
MHELDIQHRNLTIKEFANKSKFTPILSDDNVIDTFYRVVTNDIHTLVDRCSSRSQFTNSNLSIAQRSALNKLASNDSLQQQTCLVTTKRKDLGKGSTKRHRKMLRDNIQGFSKPAIRCLAHHGGVKHNSGLIYEENCGVLNVFLENLIRDAVTYTEHGKRKTVTAMDVVYALNHQGRTICGFGG